MSTFDQAVELIKGFEGFVDHVYDDGFGNLTIGYGETDASLLKKYKKGISEPEAAALLAERVRGFWDYVDDKCVQPLSDNQHIAYTSLAYNIGMGGFSDSTTLQKFNDGDVPAAAEAILLWNKVDGAAVDGLTKRRRQEHDLFLSGDKPKPVPLTPTESLATISLVCLNSSLCLDVEAESHENGASIIQWPDHPRWNQEFILVPIPDGAAGEVAIVCSHSGKVFDVAMWSTENGARIQQWDYHGGANQRWRVHATGNIYMFQNVHSGLYLDVRGMSVDPGADLIQWEKTDGFNQMFVRVRQERTSTINPVSGPVTPPPTKLPEPDPNFDVKAALLQMGFPFGNEEDIYGFQAGFSFWDLAVDGSSGPETAKAIRYALDNGGRCGKYFTFSEFGCKHCGRPRIWRETVRGLDEYRAEVGPVSIISGTRCDEHNAAVGGATNSQHRPYPNNRGISTAADIPGAVTVSWLRNKGWFSGIGFVPSENDIVVHVDDRGTSQNNTTGGSRSNPTTWTY